MRQDPNAKYIKLLQDRSKDFDITKITPGSNYFNPYLGRNMVAGPADTALKDRQDTRQRILDLWNNYGTSQINDTNAEFTKNLQNGRARLAQLGMLGSTNVDALNNQNAKEREAAIQRVRDDITSNIANADERLSKDIADFQERRAQNGNPGGTGGYGYGGSPNYGTYPEYTGNGYGGYGAVNNGPSAGSSAGLGDMPYGTGGIGARPRPFAPVVLRGNPVAGGGGYAGLIPYAAAPSSAGATAAAQSRAAMSYGQPRNVPAPVAPLSPNADFDREQERRRQMTNLFLSAGPGMGYSDDLYAQRQALAQMQLNGYGNFDPGKVGQSIVDKSDRYGGYGDSSPPAPVVYVNGYGDRSKPSSYGNGPTHDKRIDDIRKSRQAGLRWQQRVAENSGSQYAMMRDAYGQMQQRQAEAASGNGTSLAQLAQALRSYLGI